MCLKINLKQINYLKAIVIHLVTWAGWVVGVIQDPRHVGTASIHKYIFLAGVTMIVTEYLKLLKRLEKISKIVIQKEYILNWFSFYEPIEIFLVTASDPWLV